MESGRMSEILRIPVVLVSTEKTAEGELYTRSLKLREEMLNQPVDSVTHLVGADPEEGAKGLSPEETQLLVTLGSQVVPALILLISNWLMRQKDQRIHVKIGDAEIDIPPGISDIEVQNLVKTLTNANKKIAQK
jgi:hypothetical protein